MRMRANQSLVLAIDLQEKLLAMLGPERRQRLLQSSRRLLDSARALDIPILLSAQYPQGLGLIDASLQAFGEPISKTEFSCYANPLLRQALRTQIGRRQVCILGLETHICVLQTALDLQKAGWEVAVLVDAVASRDQQQQDWGIDRLRQAGVTLLSSEALFYEWIADAADPHFRQLAPAWR